MWIYASVFLCVKRKLRRFWKKSRNFSFSPNAKVYMLGDSRQFGIKRATFCGLSSVSSIPTSWGLLTGCSERKLKVWISRFQATIKFNSDLWKVQLIWNQRRPKRKQFMDTALNRRSVEKREVNFLRLIHPSLDHREILIQPFLKTTGKAERVSLKQGYPMQSLWVTSTSTTLTLII